MPVVSTASREARLAIEIVASVIVILSAPVVALSSSKLSSVALVSAADTLAKLSVMSKFTGILLPVSAFKATASAIERPPELSGMLMFTAAATEPGVSARTFANVSATARSESLTLPGYLATRLLMLATVSAPAPLTVFTPVTETAVADARTTELAANRLTRLSSST